MALINDSFEALDDWLAVDDEGNTSSVVLEFKNLSLDREGKEERQSIPMKSRRVEAFVDGRAGIAETTETLTFSTPTDCSADFRFPLPPRSAIRGFEAEVEGKVIKTVVKRKKEANRDFAQATSQGHTAVRMSQESAQNIFQVSLGNLPAGAKAMLKVEYLQLLQKVGDVLEYVHTATWVPPYYSWHDHRYQWQDDQYKLKLVEQNAGPKLAADATYPLTYSITLKADASNSVSSGTHALAKDTSKPGLVTYSVDEEVSDPSKDFQLAVQLPNASGSSIEMQTAPAPATGTDPVSTILATFTPEPRPSMPKKPRQMMLIIDCSGSMAGSAIHQAQEAASLFIRDLPTDEGIMFNVMLFGSSHRLMWKDYKPYFQSTEEDALAWVKSHCKANYGGTEMLAAMKTVYSQPVPQGYEREVLLLTDGGVYSGQDSQIVKLVKPRPSSKGNTHVYTFGIGSGVHRQLLHDIAETSNGAMQCVMDSASITAKMAHLSKLARAKHRMYNPRLLSKNCMISRVPAALPNIFSPDQPLSLLANITTQAPDASLELLYEDSEGAKQTITLPLPGSATSPGSAFRALHAMSAISELMDGRSSLHLKPDGKRQGEVPSADDVKEEIVRLALAENLVTQYTSSVGVQVSSNPVDPSNVKHHEIPIQSARGHAYADIDAWRDPNDVYRDILLIPESYQGAGISKGVATAAPYGSPAGAPANNTFRHRVMKKVLGTPRGRAVPCEEACPPSSDEDEGMCDGMEEEVGMAMSIDEDPEFAPEKRAMTAPTGNANEPPVQALNRLRKLEGYWRCTEELLKLVFSKLQDVKNLDEQFNQSKIGAEALDKDEFATVLALAFLLKYEQGKRAVWEGMSTKASTWLKGRPNVQKLNDATSLDHLILNARAKV